MVMKFNENTYQNKKAILMFPDHYVAYAQTFAKETSDALVYGVVENSRVIVKAGTIYPANDATAKGIVMNDLDITDGDETGAVIIHGFVKTDALPVAPVAAAISAMPQISFLPLKKSLIKTLTSAPAVGASGFVIDVDLVGTDFLAAITTTSNWTIDAGETGLSISTIAKTTANQARLTFTGTVAAGTLAITTKAACTANGIVSNTLSIVIA